LRHPNIVLFMGACTEPGNFAIVTELLPGGSLHDLLHNPKVAISLLQKVKMLKDIALGMNWLHCSKPAIIHRDLKPTNVLVDEHWNMKICDFGLSAINRTESIVDQGVAPGTVRERSNDQT
jgi:serine/threonine protein kinase